MREKCSRVYTEVQTILDILREQKNSPRERERERDRSKILKDKHWNCINSTLLPLAI